MAKLSGADLHGAGLTHATLVKTNLEGANLADCSVYGISAWDVRLARANQSNLNITPAGESAIQVDSLEVAQFIYPLLNNEKIRDVIDTVGKKAVLILGRFTTDRKAVLDAIRKALRNNGYLPILFDFEKPSTRDTHETIITLAGMVRFIVADITDPKSIPQELASIVPNLPSVPVQPLLQNGFEPWGMYDHIKRYP
jgi:Pentapeptide repeats (8 copies)